MRGTDGVHTHLFQFQKLTVERILIESSTQTAEVVMLTDAIDFHGFQIE